MCFLDVQSSDCTSFFNAFPWGKEDFPTGENVRLRTKGVPSPAEEGKSLAIWSEEGPLAKSRCNLFVVL